MTKLEEKLLQLGYKYDCLNIYSKKFNNKLVLAIDLYPSDIYGRVHCCLVGYETLQNNKPFIVNNMIYANASSIKKPGSPK